MRTNLLNWHDTFHFDPVFVSLRIDYPCPCAPPGLPEKDGSTGVDKLNNVQYSGFIMNNVQ